MSSAHICDNVSFGETLPSDPLTYCRPVSKNLHLFSAYIPSDQPEKFRCHQLADPAVDNKPSLTYRLPWPQCTPVQTGLIKPSGKCSSCLRCWCLPLIRFSFSRRLPKWWSLNGTRRSRLDEAAGCNRVTNHQALDRWRQTYNMQDLNQLDTSNVPQCTSKSNSKYR